METPIQNTAADNGKVIIRISNNMAFHYSFSSDAWSIDECPENYRYATKQETTIYEDNKGSERFYSLHNAPELRHEVLKDKIASLLSGHPSTPVLKDMAYKIVTSAIGQKYWEHEYSDKIKGLEAKLKISTDTLESINQNYEAGHFVLTSVNTALKQINTK